MVYDCSEYLNLHPGGRWILENQLGNDIDEPFRVAGHSEHAIRLMKSLPEVGTTTTTPSKKVSTPCETKEWKADLNKGLLWQLWTSKEIDREMYIKFI